MIGDAYLTYQFMKRLILPFNQWKAFKLGIIDADGKILKRRSTLKTDEERHAFGTFDVVVLNIKRALSKVPGGSSILGRATAAALLMREDTAEEYASALELDMFAEDAPANSAGSGAVAGLGQGPQGEPPMGKGGFARIKRSLKKNVKPPSTV